MSEQRPSKLSQGQKMCVYAVKLCLVMNDDEMT